MRLVFMGTPEFAIPSLRILLDNHHDLAAVVTVPDKPSGRGQRIAESPVKQLSIMHRIPVYQPAQLDDPTFLQSMRALQPDLFVVVAFRILPPDLFAVPRLGAFNLHASLLPKYRGPAPINWAIINGERETGVTTFLLQRTVDTGGILLQRSVPIGDDDTAGDLHDRLAAVGAELVVETVRLIGGGNVRPQKQDEDLATRAPKIFREHCRIDWSKSALSVHNFIRGLSPKPCAFTLHRGTIIKIYRTRTCSGPPGIAPGTITHVGNRLIVTAGDDAIEVLELQHEGKTRHRTEEFLRGYRLNSGERLS